MLAIRAALTFALALAAAAPVYADPTDDLSMAARGGTASDVRAAVSAGADLGARDEIGRTPLHWAAESNPAASVIVALIEAGADPGARDDDGATPLHAAALNPAASVIEALIEAGADPDARAEGGFAPLHIAAIRGNVATIRSLLAGGADADARAADGTTPLHAVATKKMVPAMLEAVAKSSGDKPLAALIGETGDQASMIRALLAVGADIDARNDDGLTPLHAAAGLNDVAAIRALLDGGANVNARGDGGLTPLHLAAMKKMILAVLEADAKDSRDKFLKEAHKEILAGAARFPYVQDEAGWKILATALKSRLSDQGGAIRTLLARGASVNARGDGGGLTPLHFGAMAGDVAAIKALLEAGGDPNAVADGCGPMDLAQFRMKNTETSIAPFRASIEALRAAGARSRTGCKF